MQLQPVPIKNPLDTSEVLKECLRRISAMDDPAAIVLTTHLFTEHWINQILVKFCAHFDLTDYGKIQLTYSQKLHIIYSIGKLPKELFENLKKLNKLRNDVAHGIHFDFTKMDLKYHANPALNQDFILSEFKPSYEPASAQHNIVNVLRGVFIATFGWLHNHCVKELNLHTKPSN